MTLSLTGFTIEGRCFVQPEELRFFARAKRQQRERRAAVVYGRNGTGKSTITEALAQLSEDQLPDNLDLRFEIDGDSSSDNSGAVGNGDPSQSLIVRPNFDADEGTSDVPAGGVTTLVFNEVYIEEQVKFRVDGLETVVLFGEQEELEANLSEARDQHEALRLQIEEIDQRIDKAESWQKAADSALRSALKAGWARRQGLIRRNKLAAYVTQKVVDQVLALECSPSNNAAQVQDLERRISEYLQIADARVPLRFWDGLVEAVKLSEIDIAILDRVIEAPTGAGVARIVGENLKRFGSYVHGARELFSTHDVRHCPMCQQSMEPTYKDELLRAISEVVDEKATRFSLELERAKVLEIRPRAGDSDDRLALEISSFESACARFNSEIRGWNDACEQKKVSLYSPLPWDANPLRQAIENLLHALHNLDERYAEILRAIDARSGEQKKLERLNLVISRDETDHLVKAFNAARNGVRIERATRDALDTQLRLAQRNIADLEAQLQNVHVAADEINEGLRAVFANRDRLQLVIDINSEVGGRYFLHNRNRPVRPSNLSVGERNIVGLVYFFTVVRQRLQASLRTGSQDTVVVVLDDPISSVDADNRLGIHGFIQAQLKSLFGHAYDRLKLIALTHDLTVARELEKSAVSALFEVERVRSTGLKHAQVRAQLVSSYELDLSHKLLVCESGLTSHNEYQQLFALAWTFASEPNHQDSSIEQVVGNAARRLLEAFSMFIYKESSVPSSKLSDEYRSLTSGRDLAVDLGSGHRLFLHDSSHLADRITALSDFGGFANLAVAEKVRHVQKLLAFMYTLQPAHVLAFSPGGDQSSKEHLRRWQVELLGHPSEAADLR